MVFRMLATLAEFERDQIAERTKSALAHKKSKGERTGTVPYGSDLANDGIKLEPNAAELEAIGLINELRAAGLSLRDIANELTKRSIPTKKGNAKWSHTAIQAILTRKAA
jgi:DNA invertase Pin-like site-specific DNA recombinase